MDSSVRIVVIGLGYVGLPLAVALAKRFEVTGFDVDSERIRELREGRDRTGEIEGVELNSTRLELTDRAADCSGADVYIVAVPTPVAYSVVRTVESTATNSGSISL